jgi:hypothetical protein
MAMYLGASRTIDGSAVNRRPDSSRWPWRWLESSPSSLGLCCVMNATGIHSSPTTAPVPFVCAACPSPFAPLRRGERPTSGSDEGNCNHDKNKSLENRHSPFANSGLHSRLRCPRSSRAIIHCRKRPDRRLWSIAWLGQVVLLFQFNHDAKTIDSCITYPATQIPRRC